MATDRDIRARDELGDGRAKYWIKVGGGILPGAVDALRLVVLDEHGHVELTPVGKPWDDAAFTREQAIADHLRGAVAEADRNLADAKRRSPNRSRNRCRRLPEGFSMTRTRSTSAATRGAGTGLDGGRRTNGAVAGAAREKPRPGGEPRRGCIVRANELELGD
jgi:hypothetical protein